jgi:hypothetical protein
MDTEIVENYVGSLKDLRAALRDYKPMKKGQPFKEMEDYLESLVEDIEDALEEPERKLLLLKAEVAAKEEAASVLKKKDPTWAGPVKLENNWWTPLLQKATSKSPDHDQLDDDGKDQDATIALMNYDDANAQLTKNAAPESKDYKLVIDLVRKVATEFRVYRPVNLKKEPHADLLLIAAKMAALADDRAKKLTAEMNKEGAKKRAEAQPSQKRSEEKRAEVQTDQPKDGKPLPTDNAKDGVAVKAQTGGSDQTIEYGDLNNANPMLYFIPNQGGTRRFRVDSKDPGGEWQHADQFCAYLAAYWLANGATGGLKFSGLGSTQQAEAVNALLSWNNVGLAAQESYAEQQIGGKKVDKGPLLEDARQGKIKEGAKIWFGTKQHARAAMVGAKHQVTVYDPNTGGTKTMNLSQFADDAQGESSFVVAGG